MFKTVAIFTVTCGIIAYLITGTMYKIVDRVIDGTNSDAAIAERMRENLLNKTLIEQNGMTDRVRIAETQATERTRIVEKTKRLGHWLQFLSNLGVFALAIALCSPLLFLLISRKKEDDTNVTGPDEDINEVSMRVNLEDWAEELSHMQTKKDVDDND